MAGPLNPHVNSFTAKTHAYFLQRTGDAAAARQMTLGSLDNIRQQQASSLAYFDVFWVCAVASLSLVALVLLMKRSVAEKGSHIERARSEAASRDAGIRPGGRGMLLAWHGKLLARRPVP